MKINAENKKKQLVTPKNQNFNQWYNDVVLRADLADYSPVKGCMVIKPNGYAIWENVQAIFNQMMKSGNIRNAYFPLFIPESFLNREKEHVEGFSPHLAVVTIGGGEELKEKLVVRPTSETIMYEMYKRWLHSWRDLPILINQWNNVVRWEKRTYLFLRTTEFLWQEGHTVHETHKDSYEMVLRALGWYMDLYRNYYAIDGIAGIKSNSERFAGGDKTLTYEMLMPDGKALQGCTSHDLGQNFAKVFKMIFLGKSGKEEIPWQTSWGLSTRSIGALIMVHGDDHGLVLPPKLASIQVVLIPIYSQKVNSKILKATLIKLQKNLGNFQTYIDDSDDQSVGWKFNDWELKGTPLRLEVGAEELKTKKIKLVRRDTGERLYISLKSLKKVVTQTLNDIQKNLFKKSRAFLKANTRDAISYIDFKKIMETKRGFIRAFWCENSVCEKAIKDETKASTRCLPLDAKEEKGKCIYCGKKAIHRWIFALAY